MARQGLGYPVHRDWVSSQSPNTHLCTDRHPDSPPCQECSCCFCLSSLHTSHWGRWSSRTSGGSPSPPLAGPIRRRWRWQAPGSWSVATSVITKTEIFFATPTHLTRWTAPAASPCLTLRRQILPAIRRWKLCLKCSRMELFHWLVGFCIIDQLIFFLPNLNYGRYWYIIPWNYILDWPT